MDEEHVSRSEEPVSWGDASKYLLIPVIVTMAGLCGWSINAFSAMSGEIDTKVNLALGRTLTELYQLRGDIKGLQVDIAKLQVELRYHSQREDKK